MSAGHSSLCMALSGRKLLVEMTDLKWAKTYDWEGRLSACEDLDVNHPTLAREVIRRELPEPAVRVALAAETTKQLCGGSACYFLDLSHRKFAGDFSPK